MKEIRLVLFLLLLFVLETASSVVLARPGEGIQIGNLRISPFLDLSITYDDNVYLTRPDETEDYFVDLVLGVAFLNHTDKLTLSGRGWLQERRYDDATDLDSDGFGERLGLIWGEDERATLSVNQRFNRLDDYELLPRSVDTLNLPSQKLLLTEDRTERVRRDIFDIAPVLGIDLTDKFSADIGYGHSAVDYETDVLFDWYENTGQIELSYEVTDKSAALFTGQYSMQNSEGFEEDSSTYVLRGGLLHQVTEKTLFKVGAGIQKYDFEGTSTSGESLDETLLSIDMAANWEATDKLSFEVSGRNGIQPATQYESNTKDVILASLGSMYKATKNLTLTAAGSYREDDYIGKILVDDQLRSKRRTLWGVRGRIDYKPNVKWCDLFVETTFEDVDDTLEDDYTDYDQWRISLGLALRY